MVKKVKVVIKLPNFLSYNVMFEYVISMLHCQAKKKICNQFGIGELRPDGSVTPIFYNIGVSIMHKKIRGKSNKSVGPVSFFQGIVAFSANRPCIIDTLIF
jgi:hypothetical protein